MSPLQCRMQKRGPHVVRGASDSLSTGLVRMGTTAASIPELEHGRPFPASSTSGAVRELLSKSGDWDWALRLLSRARSTGTLSANSAKVEGVAQCDGDVQRAVLDAVRCRKRRKSRSARSTRKVGDGDNACRTFDVESSVSSSTRLSDQTPWATRWVKVVVWATRWAMTRGEGAGPSLCPDKSRSFRQGAASFECARRGMAESERPFIAPSNVPLDQAAIAKQLSLLSQSASTRAKEYEVFNKMNAAQQHQQYRERVQNFFKFVAQYMNTRGLVLPPFISGLNTPPYDPNGSPFAWLEPGSHMSTVKVADRDVDLFKLWQLVWSGGTSQKRRIKADRALGFGGIMLRLIKRYVANIHPDYRDLFSPLARRAIETVKVIDDGEDMFVTPAESGGAILGFGMGYGESTIQRIEKGMGMFGGRQEDVTWQVMANAVDEVMFAELDSLARCT
ncbi:hypothetical protein EXIGLDRAFT_752822 [Exidia glandulosa HHB12029]|uniref:Uncharacterized protein n=1 Tax=Exidia glandulosa HHB12029 TaxID=1314781 RepID=A0A165ZX54_EXIGL|nr:hypothetical protein EXIGLDRAFT_752822 [Exidia glandulosa HHB12029]